MPGTRRIFAAKRQAFSFQRYLPMYDLSFDLGSIDPQPLQAQYLSPALLDVET